MNSEQNTSTPAGPAREPFVWTEERMEAFVGIRIHLEPEEVALIDRSPLFTVEIVDELRRDRNAAGTAIGEYRLIGQNFYIRRRDPESVGAKIAAHIALVEADEALFNDDFTPRVPQEEIDASEKRERAGYFDMIAAPCRTLADVQAKAAYLLTGTIGERDEILDGLLPDGTDVRLRQFLRSLAGEKAPPLTFDELIAEGIADGLSDGRQERAVSETVTLDRAETTRLLCGQVRACAAAIELHSSTLPANISGPASVKSCADMLREVADEVEAGR